MTNCRDGFSNYQYLIQETQKAEVTEREKEAEIDPLAPYLARMFGSGHGAGAGTALTYQQASLLREQCVTDFKAKQLERQNLIQARYDKVSLIKLGTVVDCLRNGLVVISL